VGRRARAGGRGLAAVEGFEGVAVETRERPGRVRYPARVLRATDPAIRPPPAPRAAGLPRHAPELAAAALGVAWFLLVGGHLALAPTALDWLHGGDPVQHLLGWLFFRDAPLGFPLGAIPSYPWPVGTTVALTDANPLLALALRPVQALLPRDFQYMGLWLAACFAAQGWAGARVGALASPAPSFRILSGALFVLAPPLVARVGHSTLCAHAAIIALLVLNAAPLAEASAARRALRRAAVVVVLVSAVHPYLALMVLLLALALVARAGWIDGVLPRRAALRWALGLTAAQAAVFLALGYFTSAPSHASGFGEFSADLLTFVNPLGASRLLPSLPVAVKQWEGNAYLGAGGLMLCAAAAAVAIVRRRHLGGGWRGLAPALAVSAGFFLFALSSRVTANGTLVLDLTSLYRPFAGVVAPLRASGRFVWPLYYLALGAGVIVVARALGPRLATLILAAVVALQLFDLSGLAGRVFDERPWRHTAPEWTLARGHYDHLAMFPPHLKGTGTNRVCGDVPGYDSDAYAPLAYAAYELGLTFNSAYLSRANRKQLTAACGRFLAEVGAGRLDARTIYVVHPEEEARFRALATTCGRLDGRIVCVARENGDPFRSALARTNAQPPRGAGEPGP
jgi:hypothetical protein